MSTGTVFADYRVREFAAVDGLVYLNAASYGPLPARSRDAVARFQERRAQALLTDPELQVPLTKSREAAARLVGCDAAEIALSPNTNVGINIGVTAAFRLARDRRRVVLLSNREFPANVYPWLALERDVEFSVELMPTDDCGMPREDALLERISRGDVAAVSVSFVQFSSGYRANLAAIAQACRAHDTLFVVDAIQGVGAVPLDVKVAGPDILACGGQKWLGAPWGSGFTYVRRELIPQIAPLLPTWNEFKATQDYSRLLEYKYELLDDARRFELSSLGFQDFVGFHNSLELLLELGPEQTWQHIQSLQQPIVEWAQAHQIEIVTDLSPERRSGILCIRPRSAEVVHRALVDAGVRCALRENSIRFSPHWYNTHEEVERVLEVLDSAIGT